MKVSGNILQIKKQMLNFENICYVLSAFLLALYIFFPLMSYRSEIGFISVGVLFLGVLGKIKSLLVLQKTEIVYIIALLYAGFSLVIAGNKNPGIEILRAFIFAFVLFHLINQGGENFYFFLQIFSAFAFVFMIATYLQFYGSSVIVSFIRRYLNSNQNALDYYLTQESWSSYCGLAHTSAENAFFISLLASVICGKIFEKKMNWINIVLYGICIGAIMLTGKRALVIINLFMFVMCGILLGKFNIRSGMFARIILGGLLLVCILYIIEIQTSILTVLIEKTTSKSLLNGRERIYTYLFQNLGLSFLAGKGFANTYLYYSQGAHNIYLQLLYDLGIVGLFLYVAFFAMNFKKSVQAVRFSSKKITKEHSLVCFYFQGIFLIFGISENPLFIGNMLYIYFIVLAVTQNLWRKAKNENSGIYT